MLDSGDLTNILTYLKDGGLTDEDNLIKKVQLMKDQIEFDAEVRERAAKIRERMNALRDPKE